MRFILLILFFSFSISADDLLDFPLWGSTWIIGKGQNTRAFPTVSKSIPTHLIKIEFPSKSSVKSFLNDPSKDKNYTKILISYAILTGKNYSCTADLVEDVINQFNSRSSKKQFLSDMISNSSSKDTIIFINISKRTFNDTIYSCEDNLRKSTGYAYYKMLYNGNEVTYYPGSIGDKLWHREKPLAYGCINSISRSSQYPYRDDQTGNMFKSVNPEPSDDGWLDYCDNSYCYERILCTDYKVVPTSYWQVHLFPLVNWFPRDFMTGQPVLFDQFKMSFKTAQDKKQQSINNPDNLDLKYYRNPYYSDSASCVISFQFFDDAIPGELPLNQRDYISTRHFSDTLKESEPGRELYFDRIPGKIVRVKQEMNSIEKAILRLYTDDSIEDSLVSNIYSRCGYNWSFADKTIGKLRYPDINSMTLSKSFTESKYSYHGCPCLPISDLNNFTAAEIKGFVYQAPPLCSVRDMSKAMYVYQSAFRFLNDDRDRAMIIRKLLTVHASLIDRINFNTNNKLTQIQIDKYSRSCPESWVKYFPDYVTNYSSDLRSKTEQIFNLYQSLQKSGKSIESSISQFTSIW